MPTTSSDPVAKKKKKSGKSGASDPITIESTAPKGWTGAEKLKLVKSIDAALDTANNQHCTVYNGVLNQVGRYTGPDKELVRHVEAHNEFLLTQERLYFERLDWWLMPYSSSKRDRARRDLLIKHTESFDAGENIHFYLACKALKDDKSQVDQLELLPKFYLVKFLMLAENYFARSDSKFNMEVKKRKQLIKLCTSAIEAVGGKEEVARLKAEDILATFVRGTADFTIQKSWLAVFSDTVDEIMGTKKKKKESKKKSGDRLDVPGPPR